MLCMLLENFNVLDVLLFLQEELRKIPDFSRLAKKFQRQKASLQVIYSTINNIWLSMQRNKLFRGLIHSYSFKY